MLAAGSGVVALVLVSLATRRSLSRPFFDGHARGVHSDFALYYVFAKIGLTGGWSHLYDLRAQALAYARTAARGLKYFPLPYPPPVGWLAVPFTALGVEAAYRVFETVCVAAFLLAGWLMTSGRGAATPWRLVAVLAPMLVFPIAFCIVLGQVVVLQVLGVALAYWAWTNDREVLAGSALVVLVLHPQGLLLLPLVPLLERRWKTVIAGAAGGIVVAAISLLQLRRSGLHAFLNRLSLTQRNPKEFDVVPGLSPVLSLTHHPVLKALVVVAVFATVSWTVLRFGRHRLEQSLSTAIVGSLLIAPFIHINDLILLAPAGWVLLRRRTWLWLVTPAMLILLSFGVPGYGVLWEHLVFVAEFVWLAALVAGSRSARAAVHTGEKGRTLAA